jgi:glyoxylase-like metal-dependent hydrolase (beta-lactamase superfamily II)
LIDRISDNFYRITLPMPFRLRHVHVYVLVSGNKIALFDTGFNVGDSYSILGKDLESIGLGIKFIQDIYITHAHTDHCGMAGLLQSKSGANIHLSAAADTFQQYFSNPDLLNRQTNQFYSRHGMTAAQIEIIYAVYSSIRQITSEFQADDYLRQGEIRQFGDWEFEVIFTPGHARGHVCFFFRKEKFLISGDHVLPHITPNLSPDIVDPGFRPLQSFLESLKAVENLPVERVYPGHGISFTGLPDRLNELRSHHKERTELIIQSLNAQPKTTLQVSSDIFGADLPDFDKFLALNETYVHLLELKHQGIITEEEAGNVFVYALQ